MKENFTNAQNDPLVEAATKILTGQIEEAKTKLGSRVLITKGPKDVKGKTGYVGEINLGLHKGAETYVIDVEDGGHITLKRDSFKLVESIDEAYGESWVVYNKDTKAKIPKSFKTRKAAYDYASKNGGVVYSAEYYFDHKDEIHSGKIEEALNPLAKKALDVIKNTLDEDELEQLLFSLSTYISNGNLGDGFEEFNSRLYDEVGAHLYNAAKTWKNRYSSKYEK